MQTTQAEAAVAKIPNGASLLIGGFMAVGTPERIIDEIVRQGKRELTVIANDTALPGFGIGKLIGARLVRRLIASHIGLNPETQQQMMGGELSVDLVPQGTVDILTGAYLAYRTRMHHLSLAGEAGLIGEEEFAAERAAVTAIWDEVMARADGPS